MLRTCHYRMWRLVAPVWVLTLSAVVLVQSSSPVITDFLTKDLVNPEDVKVNTEEAFTLPCKATGSNLKWSWKHNDTDIADYNGYPYTLSDDGALIGDYLRATASGTYQCFVKDEKTGAVAFSRKLKVAVTVVGKFINPTNVVVKVNLGDPFKYDCPPRKHSYGVVFSWGNSDITGHHTFSRNSRRSISSNGSLYIMYLTQKDIDEIEAYKGIRCIISGANSFQRSGTLRLEKIDKNQTDSENSSLPTWSATPNAQEIAVQGKNKTLYCFASGRPPPKITWKKDGQTIVDNQDSYKIFTSFFGRLLFIQNISKSKHEGIYTCEAANDLNTGDPISFDTTLKVEVPPKWVASPPPKNISIVIENNGTLECRVTADPAPVITWYKDGEQLQSSEHRNVDGGRLHLINTTMEEVGVFQCVAENDHGMITPLTSIDVLAWKPSFANVQFGPFHLLNEEEARLPCQPSTAAPRPTIQWFRKDELITYNENSRYQLEEDGTLVIKRVDKDQDAVNYTCKALNFKGEATVSAVLNVLVLPELTTRPENQTIMEGALVTLHCNATGNPTPKITWTKNGKTLSTEDILVFETQRNHSGKYVCTAENGLNISVNASAAIDVLYEPSLTTTPSNQTVIEGAKTTFRCIATGNPTPKITWTKDGKTLGTGETLTLAPDRTNSGEYWCSANNGLSLTVNASAYLDVQYPPSLTTTPSDQTVTENENVTFSCTAIGNPVPEIVWIKDGNIVGQGDNFSLQANRDHSGKYWCSADNSLNVAVNASTELNVLFPPSLSISPNDKTIIEGATATFICNATSNPTSKITWTKDEETVGEGDTLSFVTNRNQSGVYWCSAENGLNLAVNASAILDVQFPPSFVIQPSNQTVTENEQVTLRCSAIGNPVPDITWIKDGKTVESGEKISLKAHQDHSGKYWCNANNSLKGSINASAVLNVQFVPSLTSRPNDKIITEGATVTFYCNATGNPTPKITWTKDGKTVVEGETLSFVTNRNQSGEYWCSANNGLNSTVNASVSLLVQYPPSFTVQPSDQTVIDNEEVTLHCSAVGNPVPKITWIKDGKTLESGETLSFKALRDQSGKYWCSADNGLGGAVNASADIDVQFPPSFTSSPNDQTIIEGAMAIFRCTATGNPAPKITWTKGGKTVAKGETLSFVTHRNHSGEYWCSADNGLNPTANASANLDVQFTSSLTYKPTDQTLIENEEVTFHCSAIGNPVPKITWIKDGKTVGLEDTLRFAANRSHSGKYWCLAKNDLNVTVNASANLDVQFAPSFISKPSDQTVTEGAMATFYCTATGNPTPKITWSKDGKTVAIGETLSFEAFRNQSGKYWCIAENGLNMTVNASVNLDVQFPPSLIIKPSDQTLTENKEVTLRCTAIGNPSPKITWVKDGAILSEEETLSFEVSRDQSGVYWCSADNGLGAAVNASAELNVQFVPSLLSKPKDKTIIEGASVTFHCNSTGNPPAKITWIKDGKTVAKGNLLAFETNRTQSGEYWCSADNGLNSTANASASLDVHFPPSLVTKPSDKTLIENEEVTFHCAAIGNPVPKITWIKDGKTVGSENTLRFKANRNNSGKYWCLAKNYLNVTVNASANLDVQFAPDLISTPTDKTVTEGAMVTFHCNATGNPTPKITWSKDGKTVATGETLSFEAFRNQSGKYWCIAENGFNTTINASVNLNVQFAPGLTTKPSDQTLNENQEAKLRCAAIGNPIPKITWTKNGVFLTEGELLSFKANRHHSGKYWCLADNGLDIAVNASADLNVQFAPSLTSKPKDQTIVERATVTFHCNATGNPTPKITWTKNGETVGEGDTLSFVTNRNQSGEYWCSTDNTLNSTVNASAHLDVQYPPSLTTTPSDQTVTENESVTLSCTAIGNPVPEIVWIKDGNIVGQGDTLRLQADRDHSGKYWCSADNGLSVAVNASAELNVQFPPSFTSIPSDQITHERDQISLICRATGNPVPHIKWSKDGKIVRTGETLSVKAFRNHTGIYWCSAENSLDAINTSISLDVQFSPSFYMQPTNTTVIEGETATLFCNATGNPAPKIRWIKDGKTVGEETILTFVAKRNQSGKYWCSAENGLNATAQAIAYLDVQFSPSLTTEPKDQTIIEGTTVTFHCNATANPTAKITWTKDGKTVGEGDTLSFVTDRTQSGEYWCAANNGLNSTASASANLNVQFPPSFTTKPSDQTVIENEQLTLHCAATGNPVPNITWIKDNKTVGFEDTLSFGVQRKHSGKYWCLADNGLTEAVNASAELDVQYPPTLITSPTDKSTMEGSNVTFVCSATGNPTPAITWIKDGKTVVNGDTLNFVANKNQSGKYWCSADNGLSATVNASADLDVKFPPSLTTKPSDQSITENDEVTFYCTANGNPVPQITWFKDGEAVGQGNILSIEALRDHSGKYWCSADNGLNITVNASANLDVQFPPSLTTSPADLTVLEATFATFYCNATGNPAPKITWTKGGKTVGEGDTLSFATDRNQSGEYWCSADNGLNATVNASAHLDVQYLPSFTALPIDQIVNEAAMASFHCEATGNPTPQITWSTDGKTLATGSVLSFKANRNQTGEYWCSADNGLGKVFNTSATLDVHYNPSLATRPTNQTIIEADNATFQCTATGNPAPKITWFKDGKSVGTGETLSFEAFRNSSGEYWCLADNGLKSTDNASAFLDVQYLPDLITKAVNQTVNETDQVTFRCAAIGNPVPKITWYKDGNAVGSGSQLSFTALRNHSGKYWCLANNGLNAAVNAIAYLNVQFPPSFTKLPSDHTVTEADETTFHCAATGNPVPMITWTKDGKTVGKGTILNLKATRNETGEYWCWADNGLGKAIKAGFHLDVQYPPSLTTTPDDHTLKEKSTVTFRCAAMGNPVPKITWIKNGETVGTGNTLRFKAERKRLGTYWCSADNGLNKTVNASAYLDVLFPPGLTTQPNDQAVIEFTKATFHCNAIGNPPPKITWTKDGKTVGEGATLSFVTDRNQSGEYWCSADNGFNATVNASAILDVQFAPSFTIEPNNETVMETDITIFYCSATGNPTPKITWIKDGKTVDTGDTLSVTADRNQAGEYWCSVDNGLSEAVKTSTYLDVQFLPSFTNVPLNKTVVDGDETIFHCTAVGNPVPNIKWIKDGETVATGDTLSFEANRTHSGKYWCSVENGLGVAINASAYLDVQFSPSFHVQPTNKTVTEGGTVAFYCNATGNPAPKIRWIKDGMTVGDENTLSFTAKRNQSGKYWCSAENSFNASVQAIAYLDVQFAPRFTTMPVDQTIIEGGKITFHCSASGNPTPRITWVKDGKTVATGETLEFVTDRNQSGEYWCSADNGIEENITTSVSLNVQFLPSLTKIPTDQTVIEGATTAFRCTAIGNPTPKITWTKDGKTVGKGDTLSFVTNRNQSGEYWCSADNGLNTTVNASANLDVQYPPSLTTKPSDQTVIENEGDVILRCTANGNPVPEIGWFKDGNEVAFGKELSFEALRGTSGKYWCSVKNGLGITVNASAVVDVQFPPSLTTTPTDQTVIEGVMATFRCNATGNPAPKISWTKNGKTVGEGDTLSFATDRNQSGEYWCSAENGLNFTINASAKLDVQFAPHFTTTSVNQTVNEFDEASLHCTATGNPKPDIKWVRNGKTVGTGETLSFQTFKNHSGKYWCSADNGLGSPINASVYLDVQFSPSWIKKPTDQTVIEGATATLHCNATGNPTPKITWTKDGNTVATGKTLSFEASRNQAGEYSCSAENGLGKSINASADVDVTYPTSLASTPTNQTVKEGDETTLRCTAIGNPTPNITWIKAGKRVASGDTLTFQTNRNDSGEYWCSAENGLGLSVNASAYLNVQFPPDVTITSTYLTVVESAIAKFHCTAIGNPLPVITWTKDGKIVGTGEILSFEVSRNQSGTYRCSAENMFNKTAKASSYLDVHFKPERTRLTVNPDTTIAVQFGSFVKLNCSTYSRPDPDGYKFYRDQELLGKNSSSIYHLQLHRSGSYACVPYNSAGDGEKALLNIQVNAWKPSFDRVSFGPFYLFKGSQARLSCKPFAEPYPTFKWFKDGEAISYGQNESYSLDADGSLIIHKVKDAHSGKYTCIAQNYLGKANATADGILLERTQIVVRPQNQTVTEGANVDLRCKATADPLLELIYMWKLDGADITDDTNIQWLEEGNVLKLSDITFEETGVYTCVAYTPEPRGSEDSASAVVSITGVPSPPSHVQLTDCYNRRTNVSWSPVISNDTRITNYLIEQESNHEPNIFKLVYNVTNPNTTSVSLNIPGWSTLRFRVRAVNSAGPSRPSVTTPEGICTTPVGVPKKYPSNLKGVPSKANELFISWDPVPKTEWDAPGFYYILKYRKVNLGYLSDWKEEKIGDPSVSVFGVTNAGYYQLWEFKIRTGNHEGPGPESPIKRSFSGQDAPAAKPKRIEVGAVTASSVSIAWKPVTVKKGSVDGYKIYYWGESRAVSSRRRRDIIPSDGDVITVTGAKTQQATLTGLKPYTNYQVVVKAFNTGGEGPPSAVMVVETLEGEPGPPSDVHMYPFGEFILVTWKPPREPNGIITNYQVGSAEYNGSLSENVPVAMETVGPNIFKKLLGNATFERSYVVVVRARTSKGWGESAKQTITTIKRLAPAKPDKPTVIDTGKDVITLMYNYGVGGGWTREFKVLYKKQEEGGEFQETDWVDHFSTQLIDINSLEPKVYEFKTVGKNFVGTSPESDVIEARPEPEPVVSGQRGSPPVYRKDWFITLIILSAGTLLLLIIVLVHRRWKRRRSSNFKVTEHEKEMEKQQIEQGVSVDIKPREAWRKRLEDTVDEASHADSLDEYGGDAYFAEDGSFVGDLKEGRMRDSLYEEIPLDDPAVV